MVSVLPMKKLQERILELEAELAGLRQQQGEPIGYFQDVNEFVPGAYPRIEKVIDAAKDSPGVFPLYREAAPKQQGEPVAWIEWDDEADRVALGAVPFRHEDDKYELLPGGSFKPLYREAAPRVPEGWKLVPVEPTKEMQDAIAARMTYPQIERGYKAMLSAAPQPPDCKSEIQSGDESDNIKTVFSKT